MAIEVPVMYAGILVILVAAYAVMAVQAKNAHQACETVKGTAKDENYRRYWTYTILILSSIAGAFGLLSFVQADGPILVQMVALMCAVGAILYADTIRECDVPLEGEEKSTFMEQVKMNNGIKYTFAFLFIALVSYKIGQRYAPSVATNQVLE